jgi:hypothetical protein
VALPIARGAVVKTGVASDVFERLRLRDVPTALANDDG